MGYVASATEVQRFSVASISNDFENNNSIGRVDGSAFRVDPALRAIPSRHRRISAKRPRSSTSSISSSDVDVAEQWPTVRVSLESRINGVDVDVTKCAEFSLMEVLGTGGFGRVYLATSGSSLSQTPTGSAYQLHDACDCRRRRRRHRCFRRKPLPAPVVVKLLTGKDTGRGGVSTSVVNSLRSEANAIGLEHPNVVRVMAAGWTTATTNVIDVGNSRIRKWSAGAVDQLTRAAKSESSMAAIVMEFAGHSNLQSILDDTSVLIDLRRRVSYASDISAALSYLHSKSIVHLDVKPANIIVSALDNRCKLTDFGCSKRLSDDAVHPSTSSMATTTPSSGRSDSPGGCGTIQYRAPELLSATAAGAVTARRPGSAKERACKVDVYSLGITLWQLVSRRLPFVGLFDSPLAITYNVVKYAARPDGSTTSPHRLCIDSMTDLTDDSTADHFREIYIRCWDADVDSRPNAEQLEKDFGNWWHRFSTGDSLSYRVTV